MSKGMWDNQKVATAVFSSEVTIHPGKKKMNLWRLVSFSNQMNCSDNIGPKGVFYGKL